MAAQNPHDSLQLLGVEWKAGPDPTDTASTRFKEQGHRRSGKGLRHRADTMEPNNTVSVVESLLSVRHILFSPRLSLLLWSNGLLHIIPTTFDGPESATQVPLRKGDHLSLQRKQLLSPLKYRLERSTEHNSSSCTSLHSTKHYHHKHLPQHK